MVLFLFKLPDESAANRRVAKELVEKWTRPIFDQYRERRDVGDAQERELQLLQVHTRFEQCLCLLLPLVSSLTAVFLMLLYAYCCAKFLSSTCTPLD